MDDINDKRTRVEIIKQLEDCQAARRKLVDTNASQKDRISILEKQNIPLQKKDCKNQLNECKESNKRISEGAAKMQVKNKQFLEKINQLEQIGRAHV